MTLNSVSSEDRIKLHELCKTQLGGKWTDVSADDLIISPAVDGFVNRLYFCSLPEDVEAEHKKVVVRYVDFDMFKDFLNRTHVITISLIIAQKGISPKVLSVFSNGSIIEYIKCRYFNASDDLNPKTVEMLAQKVANFHSIEMPIPKDSTTQFLDGIFDNWFDEELKKSVKEGKVRELIEKFDYKTFLKLNYLDEMKWLRTTIEELNSPIVLCHNDINRRNILIREKEDSDDIEMFLIDFDWTNYCYRGLDLGQYFSEWGQKEVGFGYVELPSDKEMSVFIDAYIREMCQIWGPSYAKQAINSRQRLIREAKVFAMFSFLKDDLYCLWEASNTDNNGIMIKAEERFRSYDVLKRRYLDEYIAQ